ncbi:MAG: hypothetical protein JWL84_119 [Rhodospirillales bacterium]|nr:hypothetical protein [Rhodospirillales bacterium]
MTQIIRCPLCQAGDACDHDQDEIAALWHTQRPGEAPEMVEESYDASDPAQTAKREKAAKRARNIYVDDLAWLMKQRQFRNFMITLLDRCGVERIPDWQQCESTHTTAFKDGSRAVGAAYLAEIKAADMPGYLLMLNERMKQDVS